MSKIVKYRGMMMPNCNKLDCNLLFTGSHERIDTTWVIYIFLGFEKIVCFRKEYSSAAHS